MYPYSSQKGPIVNRDSNTKKLKNGVDQHYTNYEEAFEMALYTCYAEDKL